MRPSSGASVRLVALLACLGAATASAHEYWLAPSSYVATPGREIRVSAVAGTGFRGERKPWAPGRCVRFAAHATRTLDLAPAASFASETWARVAPSDGGGALLAFESDFAKIELPAEIFDAYLAAEGLTAPLAARRRADTRVPGRERYRRCVKTWLAGSDARRATQPFGLPLELIPLAAPGVDDVLSLRVMWRGKPLPEALVKAWRATLAEDGSPSDPAHRDSVAVAWQGQSDAKGMVRIPLAIPGEWMVSVVHMEACSEKAEADWESTWASLTFERAARARAVAASAGESSR